MISMPTFSAPALRQQVSHDGLASTRAEQGRTPVSNPRLAAEFSGNPARVSAPGPAIDVTVVQGVEETGPSELSEAASRLFDKLVNGAGNIASKLSRIEGFAAELAAGGVSERRLGKIERQVDKLAVQITNAADKLESRTNEFVSRVDPLSTAAQQAFADLDATFTNLSADFARVTEALGLVTDPSQRIQSIRQVASDATANAASVVARALTTVGSLRVEVEAESNPTGVAPQPTASVLTRLNTPTGIAEVRTAALSDIQQDPTNGRAAQLLTELRERAVEPTVAENANAGLQAGEVSQQVLAQSNLSTPALGQRVDLLTSLKQISTDFEIAEASPALASASSNDAESDAADSDQSESENGSDRRQEIVDFLA